MSKETKSLIEQTFLQLLEEKPLSEIDVGELTHACNLNRNTFYYHFKNIPDLIESVVRNLVDEVLATHPPTFDSIDDCFVAGIRLAKDNQQIIYHIYNSANRAIFERHLWHICEYSVTSFIDSLTSTAAYPLSDSEKSTLIDFLKFECFGFVIDWINHGMSDDVYDKVQILSRLLQQGSMQA